MHQRVSWYVFVYFLFICLILHFYGLLFLFGVQHLVDVSLDSFVGQLSIANAFTTTLILMDPKITCVDKFRSVYAFFFMIFTVIVVFYVVFIPVVFYILEYRLISMF